MPFQIIRNDITKVTADAIVNTANPRPVIGGGTDSAIYAAAGEEDLLALRRKIGDIPPGEAVYTSGLNLPATYIIHTVGPVWVDGNHGERDVLRSCYEKSLALADKLGCQSVAFPLISSGVYGFPKDEALSIAYSAIGAFLMKHEMQVILVVLDGQALTLSKTLMGRIDQYIDEHSAEAIRRREYGEEEAEGRFRMSRRRLEMERRHHQQNHPSIPFSMTDLTEESLKEALQGGKSFADRLFELIEERGLSDVEVYKKANLDKKVFSSIRCKKAYKPKKTTALALAVALKLDLPTMTDLLSRAGYALDPSSRMDLIVSYFVTHRQYNIFEINEALFDYGEPTLGSKM